MPLVPKSTEAEFVAETLPDALTLDCTVPIVTVAVRWAPLLAAPLPVEPVDGVEGEEDDSADDEPGRPGRRALRRLLEAIHRRARVAHDRKTDLNRA